MPLGRHASEKRKGGSTDKGHQAAKEASEAARAAEVLRAAFAGPPGRLPTNATMPEARTAVVRQRELSFLSRQSQEAFA